MASIQDLKEQINCHDVADRLGLVRPHSKGNYRSPHHDDKAPSLSIRDHSWKDFSGADEDKGSVIDLVMYVRGCEFVEAVKWLRQEFNMPEDPKPGKGQPAKQKSMAEWIADKCREKAILARDYLIEQRKLLPEVVDRAIKCGAVGFNDWHAEDKKPGEALYGGPAAAFIVRSMNPGHVMAVDTRYLDPELNGGVKTQCLGEREGHCWFVDLRSLQKAHTVVIVESPINALSVECAGIPGTVGLASRGLSNVDAMDWRFLIGKRVIICMDNDEPQPKRGNIRPGLDAAWRLYENLTAVNIACQLVDHVPWDERGYNDLNEIMQEEGATGVKRALQDIEPWAIAGLPGPKKEEGFRAGKSRCWLPDHDINQYWKFRVKPDFTSFTKIKKDEDGNEQLVFQDVAGFRIADISRVRIQSATATMSGEKDNQPNTVFSVSVQAPRHGPNLVRRVFEDERLHNVDQWRKFGAIFAPQQLMRLINILERTADLGAREAVNFVGLAWQDGKPVVNEGPDTYFSDPDKQCPYWNLTFPSGSKADAARVIEAYQATFGKNAALQLLVWGLGAHLKAFLGFWPHCMIQARKGSGKSTLIKRLERSIAFQMLSGQSLQTEFRLLTSISCTSHPVGWEELSARRQDIIDKAVGLLQENYQYTVTRRGSEMTEFVLSAPVLLAGEDVPVNSLLGKIVRVTLEQKGELIPENLPRFPVRNWLNYLAGFSKAEILEKFQAVKASVAGKCVAQHDHGAARMVENYSAMALAWKLLCDFAGVPDNLGGFPRDLLEVMNLHVTETKADREPWVWILDTILNQIEAGEFRYPYSISMVDGDNGASEECLILRPKHVVEHLATTPALRDRFNSMPVKSGRVFKQQLLEAGVIYRDGVERTIRRDRVAHMSAISLKALAQYGLHLAVPDAPEQADAGDRW